MTQLFFAAGTGRCGTMWLTNLLNSEANTLALHEGKIRNLEEEGEQYLPFLTLQNRQAYDTPSSARFLFKKYRGNLLAQETVLEHQFFGDVAYNYAPFLSSISDAYPSAKIIILYRNGISFVRSCTTDACPDPVPVGWSPEGKTLSKLERYISLGRLKPRVNDPLSKRWDSLSVVAKNAWLWAETNRIMFEQLASIPNNQVKYVRFEEFVTNPKKVYSEIRHFIGIDSPLSKHTEALLVKTVNKRESKLLPSWDKWQTTDQQDFIRFCSEMMDKLQYEIN